MCGVTLFFKKWQNNYQERNQPFSPGELILVTWSWVVIPGDRGWRGRHEPQCLQCGSWLNRKPNHEPGGWFVNWPNLSWFMRHSKFKPLLCREQETGLKPHFLLFLSHHKLPWKLVEVCGGCSVCKHCFANHKPPRFVMNFSSLASSCPPLKGWHLSIYICLLHKYLQRWGLESRVAPLHFEEEG